MSDEVCQVKMQGENPCGRQTYKDKKKCIFHLENKSDEEAKVFEIAFWKELGRMKKDNDIKELDFTSFVFPNQISFKSYLFEKPVIFIDAQFNNKTRFFNTQFNNRADFHKAQFNNGVDFLSVQFNNKASFSYAQFNNMALFSLNQFNNEVSFFNAQFNNKANFSSEFNNKTYFDYSEFQDAASFINAKFPSSDEDLISFKNVKFHRPKNVRFQNIDLSNVFFLNTDVSEVEFLDEKWARKNGRLVIADETHIGEEKSAPYNVMTQSYLKLTYSAVAQIYRRLRRNYEANYRFAEAGDFFIGEMEMRRLDVNTNIKNEKIRNVVLWLERNFSFLGLYKHLFLYGESYVRPLIWALIVIISYPMIMHWLFDASLPQPDNSLYAYLRESAASFFQMESTYIGERILGVLLLGLLFIALKRQFERKK